MVYIGYGPLFSLKYAQGTNRLFVVTSLQKANPVGRNANYTLKHNEYTEL